MKKLLIIIVLCVGISRSANAQNLLNRVYGFTYQVYYDSDFGANLQDSLGSYLSIDYDKQRKGVYCKYHISDSISYEGKVKDIQVREQYRTYILDKFFDNKYDAVFKILDSDKADNMKVALILYLNQRENTHNTAREIIMFEL